MEPDGGVADDERGRPGGSGWRWWDAVLPGVAVLPAVMALVRVLRTGWVPLADEGVIAIRAYDVFTPRSPVLGQMSLASGSAGAPTRSPGPMGYWVLAPATRVDPPAMVAVAAVLFAAVVIVAALALARRRGGVGLMVALAAGLVMSFRGLDPIVLAEGWNPSIGLAPVVLLVLLAWSVGVGDRPLFPVVVGVASFLAQVHLTYVLAAVVAVVVALVGGWVTVRPRPSTKPVLVGLAVGLVAWAPPIAQQLLRSPGNLSLLVRANGGEAQGWSTGAGVLAWSIGTPPAFLRGRAGGIELLARLDPSFPSFAVLGALAVVVGLLAVAAVGAVRRDREIVVPSVLVLAVLAAGVVTFSATPQGARGLSIVYVTWWFVPLGMLAWVVLGWTALRVRPKGAWAPARPLAARPRLLGSTIGACAVVIAALALTTPMEGPDDPLYPVATAAAEAVLAEVRPGQRYLIEESGMLGFQLAPYLAYEMRRAGAHPVIGGPDGLNAGDEYRPRGEACAAVVGIRGARPGADPVVPTRARTLLVLGIEPTPTVHERKVAITWAAPGPSASC